MTLCFVGCAKCISTEYEIVEVTVTDKWYKPMTMTPVIAGKVTTFVTSPAIWQITVDYGGVKYKISGSDTYNKYNDKIGQTVNGKLEIRTYDDGTIRYDIVSLQ